MNLLIGLGGNQGDVVAAFASAADALARRFDVRGASSLWQTAAIGPAQPDFLNAVLLVEADVHPLRVLAFCHLLEAAAGRDRRAGERHGPRPLDLDLLMARRLLLEGPWLTLPHPALAERLFALLPAAELAPGWVHPRRHLTLKALTATLSAADQRCLRLGPFPPFGPRALQLV